MVFSIVGKWSSEEGYEGGQSDEIFVFNEDGSGQIYYVNFALHTIVDFQYRIEEETKLILSNVSYHYVNDECYSSNEDIVIYDKLVIEENELHLENLYLRKIHHHLHYSFLCCCQKYNL